jgi:N-glycosylase/DNA lyase
MECGQVFGWHKQGDTYAGIIRGAAVLLCPTEGSKIKFASDRRIKPYHIKAYLGLDENLDEILRSIRRDQFMEKVTAAVRGLRLLKQDPWPCLCSYIISANNRVDRIDLLVKEISRRLGKRHMVRQTVVYSFPEPRVLAECPESGMRSCGVGFRAPYLVRSAAAIAGGTVDLDSIDGMSYEEARNLLMTLPGVGGKIADCVLLFAFSKYEAFPVDIWIKRAMQKVYFGSRDVKPDEIRRFGQEHFGKYAGYAQEYIYHYARKRGVVDNWG